MTITAGDSVIRGLAFHNFDYSGIYLLGGSNNQIEHNYLGTTGKIARGNQIGILVEKSELNIIGGKEAGNLISGNEIGIYFYGLGTSENTVSGNLIGTDANGTAVVGNQYGIRITAADGTLIGGNNAAARNVIAGNGTGVYIQGKGASGNRIWGNYIGVDVTGQTILGNEETGVYILNAPGNQVGGPNERGNVIAGGSLGVYVRGQASNGNLIRNNLIGVDASQKQPVRRLSGGVLVVEADNTVIGGTKEADGNHIVSHQFGIRVQGTAIDSTAVDNNTLDVLDDEKEDTSDEDPSTVSSLPAVNDPTAFTWAPEGRQPRLENSSAKASLNTLFQVGTTFTVNSTGDGGDANIGDGICADSSGNCTLRAAIQEANDTTALDTIAFNIPGSGPHTIQPGSELPVINKAVILDGTTEPDFVSTPVIELDGSNAGAGADGLNIQVANCTIRGLVINRFDDDGIGLDTEATNTHIEGNYIGTNVNGTTALGNLDNGISMWQTANVTIGGTTAAARNLISGNADNGIAIFDESADNHVIQGNIIGLDINGTSALGNGNDGIAIKSGGDDNTIGGTAAGAGNLISGNGDDGIDLETATTGNVIQGNYIGTDINGTADLGNGDRGVELEDSSNNTVGGTTAAARNLISGNNDDGIALLYSAATGNLIQGNYIGTNISGTAALGNSSEGIYIFNDADDNTIGGTTAGAGNLISGNGDDGIELYTATSGNIIQGNLIGTDASGTADLGNIDRGMELDGAPNNTIGGTTAAARNVISGNDDDGIGLLGSATTGNLIQGNYIGTNISGTAALGNSSDGIVVFSGAGDNTIGGTATGAGNLISGNGNHGINLDNNTPDMVVQGNYIGTNAAGTAAIGNGNMGIALNDAPDNTIGGTVSGAGNLISGNSAHGISIFDPGSTGNLVQGNRIGTVADGTTALGNGRRGVSIYPNGPDGNTVGGVVAGAGNIIAFNNEEGVYVDSGGTENTIRANSIFSNTNLGIDLASLGVTNNDSGDADTGANLRQNYPVLYGAMTSSSSTTISGTLNSTANLTFTLDFYGNTTCDPSGHGEGQFYLGSDVAATDGSGNVNFISTLPTGAADNPILTVTATDPNGNTSEFSTCITAAVTVAPPVADFSAAPLTGTVPLTATFTNASSGTTSYQWQFGDGATSTETNPIHIYTQAGVYTVVLTATNNVGVSDVRVEPDYITVTSPLTRTWQQITTTTSPPVWGEYAMVYDSSQDVAVLYGGNATGWPYENDTWEFDGTDWAIITTTTQQPNAVYGMAMVYDGSRIVLFGGSNADDVALAETWSFNGTNWAQLTPAASPPARSGHKMVEDLASGDIYLFGGNDGVTYYNDLWLFDGSSWSQVIISGQSPPARTLHGLAYDTSNGTILIFGGRSSTGAFLNDIWSFDVGTNTWTEITASGPTIRQAMGLAYDPTLDTVILVGGVTNGGDTVLSGTWRFEEGGWTAVDPTPITPGAAYFTLVYDSTNDVMLLFANGETWQYQ